jgi:DNA invertase Pin-like site-specific DNA recombinase
VKEEAPGGRLRIDAVGCKRIFTDKLSGAQVDRPGLTEALSHLREADTLVVWKLDRLGRSVKGLVDLVNELKAQKVHFQSVSASSCISRFWSRVDTRAYPIRIA